MQLLPCATPRNSRPQAVMHAAEGERELRAVAPAQPPRQRAGAEHRHRAGQHQQARAGGREREAVARGLRRLRELRDQQEGAEHAEADEQRREVGHRHRRLGQQPHVRPAARPCAARPAPRRRGSRGPRRSARASGALPQPHDVGLADRVQRQRRGRRPRITAPRTSTRPGVRTGDSGITSSAATVGDHGHRPRRARRARGRRTRRRARRRAPGRRRRRSRGSPRSARSTRARARAGTRRG